jgi:HNH endonuclease
MAGCTQCGNEFRGIRSWFTFNRQTGRCKECEIAIQRALIRFQEDFLCLTKDGNFTSKNLQNLSLKSMNEHLDLQEALEYIRDDALDLLERKIDDLTKQKILTDETEEDFYQLQTRLAVPDYEVKHLRKQLYILNIYRNKFPIVPQWQLEDIRFEPNEICHLCTPAEYYKVNAVSTKQGRLIATNKKLRFISATGGFEITWNSVMSIKKNTWQADISSSPSPPEQGIYMEVNRRVANGFYAVSEPEVVYAIIDTLVRIAKRQLVQVDDLNSRHISQNVKATVWQRDHGKCVQCSATDYLEFDHVIPFSKGGVSSVNNVQLLCRRCNLAKGSRI